MHKNEKEKQTSKGAINYRTGKVIAKEYPQGNTENTINFVEELIKDNQNKQILIIWDGATYHRSQEWREYQGKDKSRKKGRRIVNGYFLGLLIIFSEVTLNYQYTVLVR